MVSTSTGSCFRLDRRRATVYSHEMRRVVLLVLLAVACGTAAGCGGSTAAGQPSVAAQRDVAPRFAEAIPRGGAGAGRSLPVPADAEGLSALVARTAAPSR